MQSRQSRRNHRGRPRTAGTDTAILDATRATLVDLGWSKLTMGEVAARAGIAKTTLYRRWDNKNDLVVDAVAVLFDELRPPDRGSLAADMEDVVLQFAALLERPEARTALMAVVAEGTRDDALRRRIRSAIVDRQKRLVLQGRARAQARGELPYRDGGPGPADGPAADSGREDGHEPEPDLRTTEPETAAGAESDTEADLIFDVVAGAVVHRTLVSSAPVDTAWARSLTSLLLGGLLPPPR
ncbi:TetR/AcrR family transcriptional regulator [Streptomyces sp. NPDC006798]|uniref:TetR/AcrR family transcriptional regulator n=1 Tax=Streptomyces sp. NPDC006798 TaxID=3155462 RepID=UPI0033FB5BA2